MRRARKEEMRRKDAGNGHQEGGAPHITALPASVLITKVFIFLEAQDLVGVAMTCRKLCRAADDPRLWQRLLFLDFSGPRMTQADFAYFLSLMHNQELVGDIAALPGTLSSSSYGRPLSGYVVSDNPLFGNPNFPRGHRRSNSSSSAASSSSSSNSNSVGTGRSENHHVIQMPNPLLELDSFAVSGSSLLRKKSASFSSRLVPQEQTAKALYLGRVFEFEKRNHLTRLGERVNESIRKLKGRRARIERAVRIFSFYTTSLFLTVCPLITLILVAKALDGTAVLSPWAILAPLFALVAVLVTGMSIGFVLLKGRNNPKSIYYGMYTNFRGFVRFWMHTMFQERPRALASGVGLLLSLFVFLVLLGLKLDAPTIFPWSVAFVPFWVGASIFALSPLLGWGDDNMDKEQLYVYIFVTILLPLIAFSILLVLYLEQSIDASRIVLVFVPLFVSQAFSILCPTYMLAHSLCTGTNIDIHEFLVIVAFCCTVFGPMIAFEVLLVEKVNGTLSHDYNVVFSPLYAWFGVATIFACSCVCAKAAPSPAELSSVHPLVLKKVNIRQEIASSACTATPASVRHRWRSAGTLTPSENAQHARLAVPRASAIESSTPVPAGNSNNNTENNETSTEDQAQSRREEEEEEEVVNVDDAETFHSPLSSEIVQL